MQHSRLRACSKVDSLQPARQARIRSVDVTEPKRHLRRADDLLAAHTPGAPAPGLRGPRLLILVVERDPHIRELEAHYLNAAGFQVEFALDGNAALAQART